VSEDQSVVKETYGSDVGSIKTYLIGFIVCVILTIASFVVFGQKLLTGESLMVAIITLAVIQLFVQLKCFLHLSFKSKARWNVVTLIFTGTILLFLVLGSLWIMYSLNYNMTAH